MPRGVNHSRKSRNAIIHHRNQSLFKMTRSAFFTFSRRSSSVTMGPRPPYPLKHAELPHAVHKFPPGLPAVIRVLLRIPVTLKVIFRSLWEDLHPVKCISRLPLLKNQSQPELPEMPSLFSPAGSDSLRNHHSPDRKRNSVSAFSPHTHSSQSNYRVSIFLSSLYYRHSILSSKKRNL